MDVDNGDAYNSQVGEKKEVAEEMTSHTP